VSSSSDCWDEDPADEITEIVDYLLEVGSCQKSLTASFNTLVNHRV
jgi:hypothetical protein